jgi:predicted alpha/beta superfamily hydrolase
MVFRAVASAVLLCPLAALAQSSTVSPATPLSIGETFTIQSAALGELRRINVYKPPGYSDTASRGMPVLYMPDGGIHEDFLHIAGLVQISVMNGTMRPFILVGIENTARRRDMTGPTTAAKDRDIAPVVGGSAKFRAFIRDELMPAVKSRYRTTNETAIVGESLAGLFVIETMFLEPGLFDTYIAFDPSLWWNGNELVVRARERRGALAGKKLYLASSSEPELARLAERLMDALSGSDASVQYAPMKTETHATIYHPAALRAFRAIFRATPTVPR